METRTARPQQDIALRNDVLERMHSGIEPRWSDVAECLRQFFHADHGVVVLPQGLESADTITAGGADPEQVRRAFGYVPGLGANPYMDEVRRRRPADGEPLVAAADTLVPFSRVRTSPFYREVSEPAGMDDGIGITFFDDTTPIGHVAVTRAHSRSRYRTEDGAPLRSLADVLVGGIRRSRELRRLEARREAYGVLAAQCRTGFVVFDEQGTALDASPLGAAAIASAAFVLREAVVAFSGRARGRRTGGTEGGRIRVGGALATPLTFRLHRELVNGRRRIVCFVWEGRTESELLLQFPEGIGFSRRERDVAALLARGIDNLAMARELGLRLHTVKDYLKSVFRKLNVRNRAEAAAVLLSSARTDGLPRRTARA